jgi:hypothetical protein
MFCGFGFNLSFIMVVIKKKKKSNDPFSDLENANTPPLHDENQRFGNKSAKSTKVGHDLVKKKKVVTFVGGEWINIFFYKFFIVYVLFKNSYYPNFDQDQRDWVRRCVFIRQHATISFVPLNLTEAGTSLAEQIQEKFKAG